MPYIQVSADFPEYDTDISRTHLHVFGKLYKWYALTKSLVLLGKVCFSLTG